MELAESYGATVQGIDTLEETIQLLAAGRIDATLNADVSFYDYLNVHPDADFKIVAQTEDASHVAIPLRKGDNSATLLEAVNNAIDELRADGTLKELSEKYFGQDISSENFELSPNTPGGGCRCSRPPFVMRENNHRWSVPAGGQRRGYFPAGRGWPPAQHPRS